MFVDLGPALSMIQEGKVRAIGVSHCGARARYSRMCRRSTTRSKASTSRRGRWSVAPAKTPRPIVERLHAELKKQLATPDVSAQVAKTGMLPMATTTVADMQAFVKSEIARWGKVVQQAGIAGSQ